MITENKIKNLRFPTEGYKKIWSNREITVANEAPKRFKPIISWYEQWIWYEWMITIFELRLSYEHQYFLIDLL